ncbi:hypothetical protein J6590_039592 [Homalodisca vitripennis]|nr:hypothetical protein J6590_039592 [Homalodisca vitripennis]
MCESKASAKQQRMYEKPKTTKKLQTDESQADSFRVNTLLPIIDNLTEEINEDVCLREVYREKQDTLISSLTLNLGTKSLNVTSEPPMIGQVSCLQKQDYSAVTHPLDPTIPTTHCCDQHSPEPAGLIKHNPLDIARRKIAVPFNLTEIRARNGERPDRYDRHGVYNGLSALSCLNRLEACNLFGDWWIASQRFVVTKQIIANELQLNDQALFPLLILHT